jgi:hypothetical protein
VVGKDLAPLAEGLISGDQHGSALVVGAVELEQHSGLGLILDDVGQVVKQNRYILADLNMF